MLKLAQRYGVLKRVLQLTIGAIGLVGLLQVHHLWSSGKTATDSQKQFVAFGSRMDIRYLVWISDISYGYLRSTENGQSTVTLMSFYLRKPLSDNLLNMLRYLSCQVK